MYNIAKMLRKFDYIQLQFSLKKNIFNDKFKLRFLKNKMAIDRMY